MLVESALTTINQSHSTDSVFPKLEGGVLTASTALGLDLVERLKKKGMTWEITEDIKNKTR